MGTTMNVPDELVATFDQAFSAYTGNSRTEARRAGLAAVFRELDLPPEFFDLPCVMAEEIDPQEPDVCRPVEIDGETILVRGEGQMTDEDQAALTSVVPAAKRRLQAEQAAERAEIEGQVRAKIAEEMEPILKDLRKAARTHHYTLACEGTDAALARLRAVIRGEQ
jgi:hypothetical protein